jgi:hypothetical protein
MTHPSDAELDAWSYSLLEPEPARALEVHVGQCEACARRLREVAQLSAVLEGAATRSRRFSRALRLGTFAVAAAAAALLALTLWPTQSPRPVEEVHSAPVTPQRLREQRRQLESLGRDVEYEALPDPAYQPDEV